MFEGTKVKLGDAEYVIPPITMGQLRSGVMEKVREHDKLAMEGKSFEALVSCVPIIGAAIRRNYPDFSDEKLEEVIDMGNVAEIFRVVLGASSLGGEAGAGAQGDPTMSGPSTAS